MHSRFAIRTSVALVLVLAAFLAACSTTPEQTVVHPKARLVCDSYLVLDMCVQDLVGDGTVDLIYFSDTMEIFMYQEDRLEQVSTVMPLHRCAVPLNPGMQATTNRILERENLTFTEELGVTKELLRNYVAAKPSIDECNARFEAESPSEPEEEFFMDEDDWEDG